ncbi:MAG: hypothetical protein ACO27R_01040 [Hylemonella sp.]
MKTLQASVLVLLVAFCWPALAENKAPVKKASKQVRKPSPRAPVASVEVQPPMAPLQPLGEAELDLAKRVFVGYLPCEMGASVTIEASPHQAGYFQLRFGKHQYHMAPVQTTTGAIRLEDHHAHATWLQLANKSMLVSDKLGRRLVDACMTPDQLQYVEQMKTRPVVSVLDDLPTADGTLVQK